MKSDASTEGSNLIFYGVYECIACKKEYMVNDQWKPCTPELCHNCYENVDRNDD